MKDEEFFSWLDEHGPATIAEISDYFGAYEGPLPQATVRWRLHRYVEQGQIYRIGRGKYSRIGERKPFKALPNNHLLENMAWFLKGRFDGLPVCVWDTKLLSGYTIHQPSRSYGIIEVDRYAYESVMDRLMSDEYLGPFIYDNNRSLPFKGHLTRSNYDKRPVIVRHLLQEAPVEHYHGLMIPTIEKLIVDLICDEEFFLIYQGRDLENMLEAFYARHPINDDKLRHYASYRSQENKVQNAIWRIRDRLRDRLL